MKENENVSTRILEIEYNTTYPVTFHNIILIQNFQEQKILSRQKRQAPNSPDYNAAEKSGVPIFDHAYGDHEDNSRVGYQLAIYPKLMGDLDDGQAYNQGLNQNNQPQNTQPAEISWGDLISRFHEKFREIIFKKKFRGIIFTKNFVKSISRKIP